MPPNAIASRSLRGPPTLSLGGVALFSRTLTTSAAQGGQECGRISRSRHSLSHGASGRQNGATAPRSAVPGIGNIPHDCQGPSEEPRALEEWHDSIVDAIA